MDAIFPTRDIYVWNKEKLVRNYSIKLTVNYFKLI